MNGPPTAPAAEPERARWRNIGVVAHINAGKTTLTERILFDTGRQRHCGDVDSGTATTDWQREEQERGISIEASVTDVPWRGHRIQLVDTPGHVDFAAEVERALRVLDGAVVVVDGVRGVEPQTETVWRLLDRLRVPRLVFVNKLDRPSADFDRAVETIRSGLGVVPVPVVVPVAAPGGGLGGLLDTIGGRSVCWEAPPIEPRVVEAARAATVDRLADLDDELLAQFVAAGHADDAQVHAALRRQVAAHRVVPVFAGSALHNRGVEPLLDGVCRYLPSPLERLRSMLSGVAAPDADAALAFVFKGLVGPDTDIDLVRVFRGELRPGVALETGDGQPVQVRGLWSVHADHFESIPAAGAGAIVGIRADRPLRTGETLRAPRSRVVLEPIRFSEPVLESRVEPRSVDEWSDLVAATRELVAVDPTLQLRTEPESGSLLIAGMGELHLDVFRARLERRLGHEVCFAAPMVVGFTTVAGAAVGEAECERAVASSRLRARARVRVEPAEEATPIFRWAVSGDVDPAARDGLLQELAAFAAGGIGAPVRQLAIEVQAVGWEGPVATALPLLAEAAGVALRRALDAAGPVRLEPWVRFLVVSPADCLRSVLADLRARGARLEEVFPSLETAELRGTVALARMLGYATPLRSMTRGRGTFELQPDSLQPADG